MKNLKFLLLFSVMLAACGEKTPPAAVKSESTKTVSAETAPIKSPIAPISSKTSTLNEPKVKIFNAAGTVTKVNLQRVSAEIDHDNIEGLMPKMKMEFYVKEKNQLQTLKKGDKVEFVLEVKSGTHLITSIKKIQ